MLYNRDFAKLNEQVLDYAPLNQKIGDTWYCPATEEQQLECGYKKIVDTPYPDDGKNYISHWEEKETTIEKVWEEIPTPPDPRTPAQKREEAYQTRLCIVYPENSNELITVDGGVRLVGEYSCETTERAADIVAYLRKEITEKKQAIREEFPDEE